MANVLFDTDVGDKRAWYIWSGEFSISQGNWGGFDRARQANRFRDTFSENDWAEAIARATKFADEEGFSAVIVVRNS